VALIRRLDALESGASHSPLGATATTLTPAEQEVRDERVREFLAEPSPSPPKRNSSRRRSSVDLKSLRSKLDHVRAHKGSVDERQGLFADFPEAPEEKIEPADKEQEEAVTALSPVPLVVVEGKDECRLWKDTMPLVLPAHVIEAQNRFECIAARAEDMARPANDGLYAGAAGL